MDKLNTTLRVICQWTIKIDECSCQSLSSLYCATEHRCDANSSRGEILGSKPLQGARIGEYEKKLEKAGEKRKPPENDNTSCPEVRMHSENRHHTVDSYSNDAGIRCFGKNLIDIVKQVTSQRPLVADRERAGSRGSDRGSGECGCFSDVEARAKATNFDGGK
ncbi:unnamed protein product [Nesidiocoris tenuis]|uniref:Uncharacterized protein n=1 Tax=Nesidiocoris tenuis TaxID=355587 RepID=A0A6H5FY21_9HEMI|nr:unnamed protein product [Nesidiocoris tenuis]